MKISYAQEMELCKALLTAHGMNADDAGLLGESVAHSDFTGIYSHGLSRFANYLKRFENGAMKPNAKLSVAMDGGSTVAFDCDNGCGVVVMYRAYEQMVERARKYGIVIATGRRASNIGCGSFFCKACRGGRAHSDVLLQYRPLRGALRRRGPVCWVRTR